MEYVRYQERTFIGNLTWVLVHDTIITMDNYVGHFIDAEIAKDTINHPGQWFDDGRDYYTDSDLEHRVVEVFDDSGHERVKASLLKNPSPEELKTLYQLFPKFTFFQNNP